MFGSVDDGEATSTDVREVELAFKLHFLAAQHLLDVRAQGAEALVAKHLRNGLAENFVTLHADHLRIGIADEAIAQIRVQRTSMNGVRLMTDCSSASLARSASSVRLRSVSS